MQRLKKRWVGGCSGAFRGVLRRPCRPCWAGLWGGQRGCMHAAAEDAVSSNAAPARWGACGACGACMLRTALLPPVAHPTLVSTSPRMRAVGSPAAGIKPKGQRPPGNAARRPPVPRQPQHRFDSSVPAPCSPLPLPLLLQVPLRGGQHQQRLPGDAARQPRGLAAARQEPERGAPRKRGRAAQHVRSVLGG